MGKIGSFGKISFYVKRVHGKNKMLSFSDFTWSSSAEYEEHSIINKKPSLEFLGAALDEITLNIIADANYGVSPHKIQDMLHRMEQTGEVHNLVVGGRKIGKNKWVITELTDTYKSVYHDGRAVRIDFSVTLKECVVKQKKKKKKKKTSAKGDQTTATRTQTSTQDTTPSYESGSALEQTAYQVYTIVSGDTLWGLAKRFYGSGTEYLKIYNANRVAEAGFNIISDPSLIYPGWIIKIPS